MSSPDPRWSSEAIAKLVTEAGDLREGLSTVAIDALMEKGLIQKFTKGRLILEREAEEPKFHMCLSGTVRLTAITEDGREFISVFMTPGKVWGVHSCLDGTPETHDSRAETDCEVLGVSARNLRELMWQNRELQEAMTEILCKRLRLALNVLEQFATWNPRQRLAWRILQILRSNGGGGGSDSARQSISVSQEAIASMIALSRQRTNKLLKEFEQEGFIKIEYGSIRVLDEIGLEAVLEHLPHF